MYFPKTRQGKIIDLSHEFNPLFVEDKEKLADVDMRSMFCTTFKPDPSTEWHIAHFFASSSHAGTHLEAPYHWFKEGKDIASISIENLIGPALKQDFSRKKAGELITLNDVLKASKGKLHKGDFVFLQTNHSRLWGTKEYWLDSPYLSVEAAQWLMEKGVRLVGIDAPRLDCYAAKGRQRYIIHEILHRNNVLVIENMANLEKFKDRGTAFVLPLKIRGMDAFPTRVIIIEGEEEH